jgi:hypothetical protein
VANSPVTQADLDGHMVYDPASHKGDLAAGGNSLDFTTDFVGMGPEEQPEQKQQQVQQQSPQSNTDGPFIAKEPGKYMGKVVGSGQCVDFVKADTDVPRQTKNWGPGAKVDQNAPQGAAIATFGPDGKYKNIPGQSHAAELVSVAPDGKSAKVRDQWNGRPVRERKIHDRGGTGKPVNDLSRYRVIMKRED